MSQSISQQLPPTRSSQFYDLLLGMTEKELKARYKHTVFGFLWVLINPVLQMVIIGFVFKYFIKEPIENYYFYLFTGLLLWNFFTISLTKATPSIVYERGLIKKARFPRSVIPLSIILSNLVHYLIALALFMLPITFLGIFTFNKLPILLLGVFLLTFFTAGISLLTSALNVRYRDINFFVQALLIVWFYATPIIYSLSAVPADVLWLWHINPLTCIIQYLQYALVDGKLPIESIVYANVTIILIVTLAGWIVFERESKIFDDLI